MGQTKRFRNRSPNENVATFANIIERYHTSYMTPTGRILMTQIASAQRHRGLRLPLNVVECYTKPPVR
jgi:hypothetical protein